MKKEKKKNICRCNNLNLSKHIRRDLYRMTSLLPASLIQVYFTFTTNPTTKKILLHLRQTYRPNHRFIRLLKKHVSTGFMYNLQSV
jgi:hypothetical protein